MLCTNAFKINHKPFLFQISATVSETYSTNHQTIKGYQGVPATNFNHEDQVNKLHAPLCFNQVNQSLYHSKIAPQSWVNSNLPQSLSFFFFSKLNNCTL